MKRIKIIFSLFFAVLFVLSIVALRVGLEGAALYAVQIASLVFALISVCLIIPGRERGYVKKEVGKLSKRTLLSILTILLFIPFTIFYGFYFLGDRKYYFISTLVIIETLIPFFIHFEGKKPQARELVIISVLCAVSIAGRVAFFALPQFKPVIAIVIIAGVCFGGEAGFLVGAVTGFVSNFYFGQWSGTPWQMFAFGIIGFLAGVLYNKRLIGRGRVSLSIFGFFAAIIIYGGIMNPASVILWAPTITWEMIISSFVAGFMSDLIHALSTVFFLAVSAEPIIEKIERIKEKNGILR